MADMLGEESETPTFRCYAEAFFIWGECPHIRSVLEETGRFTQRHARIQCGRLEKCIFGYTFANKRLLEITWARYLISALKASEAVLSSDHEHTIDVVKIVLCETVNREELDRDPTEMVRRVSHKKRECSVFTVYTLLKNYIKNNRNNFIIQ
jgi:hypothetical protein